MTVILVITALIAGLLATNKENHSKNIQDNKKAEDTSVLSLDDVKAQLDSVQALDDSTSSLDTAAAVVAPVSSTDNQSGVTFAETLQTKNKPSFGDALQVIRPMPPGLMIFERCLL